MQQTRPRLSDILRPEANNLGAVRLAMAVLVLVSHSFWLATGDSGADPVGAWTGTTLGEYAVQVFFFLSGIVVAQSLFRSAGLADFLAARVLRIMPALVACVLLTALVLGPLVTTLGPRAYLADKGLSAYLVRTLSLSTGSAPLPGVFDDLPLARMVNVSLWTLKYEVACYALLAGIGLLYVRAERLRPTLAAALAVLVVGAFAGWARPVEPLSGLGSLRYFIVFFFTGTLAFLARDRLVIAPLALAPLIVLWVLAFHTPFAEIASAACLGYATLCFAALPLPRLRAFTNAQDYSYGVYILACPVQQLLLWHRPGIGPIELSIVALLIVGPLAVASWNLVERPAMRQRGRLVAWLGRLARWQADAPRRSKERAAAARRLPLPMLGALPMPATAPVVARRIRRQPRLV